jgi:hypothetical protein
LFNSSFGSGLLGVLYVGGKELSFSSAYSSVAIWETNVRPFGGIESVLTMVYNTRIHQFLVFVWNCHLTCTRIT